MIESKDDMRQRGMPSPDRAAAVMIAMAKVNLPESSAPIAAEDLLGGDFADLEWADSSY